MSAKSPSYRFTPGEYLKDELEARSLTVAEFALQIDKTEEFLIKILECEADISLDTATRLSNALGTSVEIWVNLQAFYNECE
jgi:HTH-type transcriptional regulator/antitoxin HigA